MVFYSFALVMICVLCFFANLVFFFGIFHLLVYLELAGQNYPSHSSNLSIRGNTEKQACLFCFNDD